MRTLLIALALGLIAGGVRAQTEDPGPESNQRDERYYTENQARQRVYGTGTMWYDTMLVIDSIMDAELHHATGLHEAADTVRLQYGVDQEGRLIGAYRIASEVGKFHPFEFLVGLDSTLRVRDIVVLNYRESRGGDVRRARFTRQFRGKSVESPVRLNRDILGISGATLSSIAVNRGVKKTLWWANRVWSQGRARR